MIQTLPRDTLLALARFDTCAIVNAIESFQVRLRDQGFVDSTIECRAPALPPMLGYAVTVRVRSAGFSFQGGAYLDRTDWWKEFAGQPAPHVLVIQDLDRHPGTGAFVGEVHAAILKAFGGVGAVTNGAVRDLPAVEAMGFHLFSGSVAPSHAYMHIVEVGKPVEIGGLKISPGDLLHGDRHGIVQIPLAVAERLPETADRIARHEREIIRYCQAPGFTPEGLRALHAGSS